MLQTLETALLHIIENPAFANNRVIVDYPESVWGDEIRVEYNNAEDALYCECEENHARDYIVECVEYMPTETIITISQEEDSHEIAQ